mgnify:CR=1 FL=1
MKTIPTSWGQGSTDRFIVIFVCQNTILQTNFKKNAFLGYGDEGDDFAFVIIPGFRPENVPGYKLIQSETGDVFISLNNLKEEGVEKIETAFRNRKSIEQYLEEYEILVVPGGVKALEKLLQTKI